MAGRMKPLRKAVSDWSLLFEVGGGEKKTERSPLHSTCRSQLSQTSKDPHTGRNPLSSGWRRLKDTDPSLSSAMGKMQTFQPSA
jgi:hypothetical protein